MRGQAGHAVGPRLVEHRVRVAGDVVAYGLAGEGPAVGMIHGLGGSSRCWGWTVPALARRHRVFLVDLPGFGRLRRLRRRFALDTAAAWLTEWLAAVGVGRAHFVGHSMGAFISAQIAAAAPALVERLVLVSAAGVPTGRSWGAVCGTCLVAGATGRPALGSSCCPTRC